MDINLLVNITSRAWALPVLAQLADGTPGRQAALLAATGAGRTALAQTLDHLIAHDLLERNPGHGHPLRPEFQLTSKGAAAADVAQAILRTDAAPSALALLRKTWTVPVLAMSTRPRHFSQLKRSLPRITDRALSHTLKALQSHHWLGRRVDADLHPPRPSYQAIGIGARIGVAAGVFPTEGGLIA